MTAHTRASLGVVCAATRPETSRQGRLTATRRRRSAGSIDRSLHRSAGQPAGRRLRRPSRGPRFGTIPNAHLPPAAALSLARAVEGGHPVTRRSRVGCRPTELGLVPTICRTRVALARSERASLRSTSRQHPPHPKHSTPAPVQGRRLLLMLGIALGTSPCSSTTNGATRGRPSPSAGAFGPTTADVQRCSLASSGDFRLAHHLHSPRGHNAT